MGRAISGSGSRPRPGERRHDEPAADELSSGLTTREEPMETDTTDTARLYWLEAELEKAARNGLLLERLRDLGMRFLIYRDLREAIDAARAETAAESAGGAMSETSCS